MVAVDSGDDGCDGEVILVAGNVDGDGWRMCGGWRFIQGSASTAVVIVMMRWLVVEIDCSDGSG